MTNTIFVSKERAEMLFERLKIADETKSLPFALKEAMAFKSLFLFNKVMSQLQSGEGFIADPNIIYLIEEGIKQWEIDNKTHQGDITLTVTGFNTIKEAEEFCNWYSGQGQDDACIWFEARKSEGVINCEFMDTSCYSATNNHNIEMTLEMK